MREHVRRHLRLAVLLTGDWHAAEDLVQTALVKLHRAWPGLDTKTQPDAYFRRILINLHTSWWRTRWRGERPVEDIPDRPVETDGEDQRTWAVVLRQALLALPPRQRAVLVLRFFEDLSEAKVAELLGCSAGSVKTHAHRGIQKLRTLLDDEIPEPREELIDSTVNRPMTPTRDS
ncbi:SigE family RNA polymerase sigma factor [Actinoallomurus acanthiterrae]